MRVNRLGNAMARAAHRAWQDLWRTRAGLRELAGRAVMVHARLPHEGSVKPMLAIFTTIFLAELGDKTQLATLLFASERQHSPLLVFVVASGALAASTALAVVCGTAAERYLGMLPLKLIAGAGFLLIGSWTIWDHFTH